MGYTSPMLEIVIGVAGLAVGWLAAQILSSRKLAAAQADAAAHAARAEHAAAQITKGEASLEAALEKSSQLAVQLATATADNTNLTKRLEEESSRLEQMQERLKTEFENLANRVLEEKSKKFLSQNQDQLSSLMEPLRLRLGEFRERVDFIHTEETKSSAALREQLQQLRDLNQVMTEEARNLTSALKGQSKTQGIWGEMILESILEKSGLKKGSEYDTQASFQKTDGARLIPDAVIYLPENKHLIIDAKVSLVAYERSVSANDENSRLTALREHSASVRRHVDELARKDYPGLPELQSPDFVLMFVPVEPALHLALQADTNLFAYAFDKNVVMVTSSTLLISLRAIESVWRRHKQTLNSLEIARQAGNLHDQFVLFVESLQDIGQRLDQARTSYDKALGRLSEGKGNLIRRVTELQKLGARAEKKLPASLLEQQDFSDERGEA